MARICVVGSTLAAMAAAARLAKQRHEVTLVADPDTLVADAIAATSPTPMVDLCATDFTFPAPWRDLFRKSGRALDAELSRLGWQLTEAPARPVGTSGWLLPAERGAQFGVLSERFGSETAERWRDLLDGLDEAWLVRRRLGMEFELDRRARRHPPAELWSGRSLADLAEGLPNDLAELVTSGSDDPARSPAVDAVWLAVERTFGRWHLVSDDRPMPAARFVEALSGRLSQRKVRIDPGADRSSFEATVHAERRDPDGRWLDRPGPRRRWRRRQYQCGEHTAAGTGAVGQLLSAALATYAVHLDLTGADIHPSVKAPARAGRAS